MNFASLKNKTILVTGASSGIGAECSSLLSKYSANLILMGRNADRLSSIERVLDPGDHSIIIYDFQNVKNIESILIPVLEKYKKIDGFIHSAGIDLTLPISNLTIDDYLKLFNINVFSGFEIARVLSKKKYIPENGASFVFIASIMATNGAIGKVAYSASKGAIISGCRSLAIELAQKKIRVNCISPAIVQTKLVDGLFSNLSEESVNSIVKSHPLGLGRTSDISEACYFLISEKSRWITGSNLVIDGGYSIV
jgi:NAD(P)-dependent dehydrogenase (short-subunit alcohol dehydrogenase family)